MLKKMEQQRAAQMKKWNQHLVSDTVDALNNGNSLFTQSAEKLSRQTGFMEAKLLLNNNQNQSGFNDPPLIVTDFSPRRDYPMNLGSTIPLKDTKNRNLR